MVHVSDLPNGGAANRRSSDDETLEKVEWAGLPVDLDMAFSRNQRDKVYVQHLLRKRGAQMWRWLANDAHSNSTESVSAR